MAQISKNYNMLARHGELIERIYAAREYQGDNDDWHALSQLVQAGVLYEDEGTYRLTLRDRNYNDEVMDRTRAYTSGTPISDLIEGMTRLIQDMKSAERAGNETGREEIEDEAIARIYAIPQEISRQLRLFDVEIRNGFHDARTLEERERRNEFYLDKATRINDAIAYLNSDAALSLVGGTSCHRLRRSFQRQIKNRIKTWSTVNADLINEMKVYLHKTKEVAAQTKRMRAILAALKNVSIAEQMDAIATAETVFHPMKVTTIQRPDYRSPDNEEAIIAAAAKLDPGQSRSARRRQHAAADIRHVPADVPEENSDMVPSEVTALLAEVSATGHAVSAMTWAEQHGLPRAMLFTLMVHDHVLDLATEGGDFSVTVMPEPSRFSTRPVEDVIVTPRAA